MVEIFTRFTHEDYTAFQRFSLFRGKYYRYWYKVLVFVPVLLCVLLIALRVLGIVEEDTIVLFMIVFCFFLYLSMVYKPKQMVKSMPTIMQLTHTYIFSDDSITQAWISDVKNGRDTISYDAVSMVYETKDMFYVFYSRVEGMIVPKRDIVSGSPDALRSLLQSKLQSDKYVVCK